MNSLFFGPLPDDVRPGLDAVAPATQAVLAIAADLAGPERALEGARTVVAWAYGFVSMELAGAFRLAATPMPPSTSASSAWRGLSPSGRSRLQPARS